MSLFNEQIKYQWSAGFNRHLVAVSGLLLGLLLVGSPAFGLPERSPVAPPERQGREQSPRRKPPQLAIDACAGKSSGDSCTFVTSAGSLDGECLSGVENIFACRPLRGELSRKPVLSVTQQQQDKAAPAQVSDQAKTALPPVVVDSKPVEDAVRPPERPITSSSGKVVAQHGNLPEPAANKTPVIQVPPAETAAGNGFFEKSAGSISLYFLVAVLSALLTWLVFFRYAIVPLRRLRKVTRQLAGGDLSARVGEGLVARKGEVAELGRDVDRMAERIENLVGAQQRLIRDVSHELRSPLARLNVALELARQSAGPAHGAPFDRIERESDRLNELIGQLLMLTKLEDQSGMAQKAEIDIAALITEVAHDVDFEARGDNRRVETRLCGPLCLNGNRELLRQALENLVRNAARYTASGTAVEITMRKRESAGQAWAHIEVRDQGPGVPESLLYEIFRPFYRVNDARERQSGGAGVGLAISDRAVRLHGGSLRAFNAAGTGLVMEMELPLVKL